MTTVVNDDPRTPVFEGIYDVPEAARYLKAARRGTEIYPASSTHLIRWIRRGLASPGLTEIHGRDMLIAFEDLVSMRVIVALRAAGVGWHDIYLTEDWLRVNVGAERPFATETVWTGQGELFAGWSEQLISVGRYGQLALDLLLEFLIPIHGLTFSEMSHTPTSWEPVDGITLDPQIQFGSPCLKGTRIPTRTISGMVEAGDSEIWVAEAYGLSIGEVHTARDWESRLIPK